MGKEKSFSKEPIESEAETIKQQHPASKASALRQTDDDQKMFEFQFYDELVPESYDAQNQTVKINFTARDTVTFQLHQFVAEADVLSSIDKGKKVKLSTARFFENNQEILKKLGVLEWSESNPNFKVTLSENKKLVKEKLEAAIEFKQSELHFSNSLEEVAQLSGEIDGLEEQLEIIDYEACLVPGIEEKQVDLSLRELIAQKDLKGIEAHLREGISQYLDSDTFKNYLDFACQFQQYSYRNKMLIQAQNPNASLVAGYRAWQNKGRQVQRGQKALKIFVPNLVAQKGKDGKYLLDDEGKVIKAVKGFYLASVYDVSQTEGQPLPKPIYELEENIKAPQKYEWYIKAIMELSPVPIKFSEIEGTAKGFFVPSEKEITIRPGMSQTQTIKTMLHEVTHSILHDLPVPPFGSPEYAQHEIEAESVAYMVANSLGIETQEYSFGYLASWTNLGLSLEKLEQSLDLICQQAQKMMSELDDILKQIPIQEQSQEKEKQTVPRQPSSLKMHL
ncbi:ArdC-like ssDNA-binding domain-containing protein [Lactococcus lactis]|uniref:Antirestriction protein ArdC n=1 Tax=Lactococcus lactis TaxID=1358 RepID=A0AAW5TRE5_9LACT|nr:ArdC-like ssDNA-binding domain-containing protein [Lactococcus lactis]MCW2280149.1 antirestriction protein ArdC [Lactococcus lactis]